MVEQNLLRAESLIQDFPDSALVILDSIYAQTPLRNSEQNARLALLLTQARDKNYYFETNDSLISVACDYIMLIAVITDMLACLAFTKDLYCIIKKIMSNL